MPTKDELTRILGRVKAEVMGMNGFIDEAEAQVMGMNGAVDDLDRKVGALRGHDTGVASPLEAS